MTTENKRGKSPSKRPGALTWASELVSIPFDRGQSIEDVAQSAEGQAREHGVALLRWGAVHCAGKRLILDVHTTTSADGLARLPARKRAPQANRARSGVAFIVPTGLGARIGGFIGDAGPSTRYFSGVAKPLLIHPNVANAAALYSGTDDAWYVDGFTLDQFLLGDARLNMKAANRIGVIVDRLSRTEDVLATNAINAAVSTWGIDIAGVVRLSRPLQSRTWKNELGLFSSTVDKPGILLDAASKLVAKGANVIAVLTGASGIPKVAWREHYFQNGPNPIGSFEALISRGITAATGLPCAHAPAFNGVIGEATAVVDSRVAAEVISRSGLPSVLRGLSLSPAKVSKGGGLSIGDIAAIVVPENCCAGVPSLAAETNEIPLMVVSDNKCIRGVGLRSISLRQAIKLGGYADAAGEITRRSVAAKRVVGGPPA